MLLATVSHLVQLGGERTQPLGGLLLSVAGLFGGLAPGLAQQVLGLPTSFLDDLARLVLGGAGDVLAGLGGRAADLRGLVPRDLRGGWVGSGRRRHVTAGLLAHCELPCSTRSTRITSWDDGRRLPGAARLQPPDSEFGRGADRLAQETGPNTDHDHAGTAGRARRIANGTATAPISRPPTTAEPGRSKNATWAATEEP